MLIPRSFMEWLGMIAVVSVGFFAIVGTLDKAKKQHRNQADEAETRLITILKEEVKALTRKIENYETRMSKQDVLLAEIKEQFIRVETENKTLKDILSGQDKDSVDYRKQSALAAQQIAEIYKYVPKMVEEFNQHLANHEKLERQIVQRI
jgi:hypothetical protein